MDSQATCAVVDVRWKDWWVAHLLWPLTVQIFLALLFACVCSPWYQWAYDKRRWRFRRFIEAYIGQENRLQVSKPYYLITLYTVQALASIVSVAIWMQHTYWRGTRAATRRFLIVLATLDGLNWLVARLQSNCSAACVWHPHAIIDMLTIIPTFRCWFAPELCSAGEDWLSLHFLRALSVMASFKGIQRTGVMEYTALKLQTALGAMCEILSIIITMAGSMYTSELLGDPDFFGSTCVSSKAGEPLTVLTMIYWTMVSITTVGYGDISPKATLSRLLCCAFIVLGVATVFKTQYKFTTLWNNNFEGAGCYTARMHGEMHVVLVLNVGGRPAKVSSILKGFLHEVLHDSHCKSGSREEWPTVIVFAPALWDAGSKSDGRAGTTFEEFLKAQTLSAAARARVKYIIGKVTNLNDLNRAGVGTSMLTIVVSDVNSHYPDEDDGQCIYTALVIRDFFPKVRMRLMLLRPESKNLAVQSGIEAPRCFSVRELKANILAQNVRCHGLLPAMVGMLKTVDVDDKDVRVDCGWMNSYLHGMRSCVFGFLLSAEFDGRKFGDVAVTIFRLTGALLIGVIQGGRLMLCPQTTDTTPLREGQVCFAIADKSSSLDPVSLRGGDTDIDWRARLAKIRDCTARRVRHEGVHVAAAKLVGRQAKAELIDPKAAQVRDRINSKRTRGSYEFVEEEERIALLAALANYSQDVDQEGVLGAKGVVRRMREDIHADPRAELVLLVVCHGAVWAQVHTFCVALCANFQPRQKHVIILAPSLPPMEMFKEFEGRVACMQGSFTSARNLVAAGLLEARSVVVMSGEPSNQTLMHDPQFDDYRVVLCAQEIECWCGVSSQEVFAVYELQHSRSIWNFPPLVDKPIVPMHRLFDVDDSDVAEDGWHSVDETPTASKTLNVFNSSGFRRPGGMGSMNSRNRTTRVGDIAMQEADEHKEGGRADENESIGFHPRFAAGQIFTPELWGLMLGRMFYMPAVIELVEALVMPHQRGQQAYSWQIRVPFQYIDRPFVELFADLTLGASCGPFYRDSEKQQPAVGPGIPLAIYRARDDLGPRASTEEELSPGTGGTNYIILGPEPDFLLREDDWILVLGSARFGEETDRIGKLRGSVSGIPPPRSQETISSMAPRWHENNETSVSSTPKSGRSPLPRASVGSKQSLESWSSEEAPKSPGQRNGNNVSRQSTSRSEDKAVSPTYSLQSAHPRASAFQQSSPSSRPRVTFTSDQFLDVCPGRRTSAGQPAQRGMNLPLGQNPPGGDSQMLGSILPGGLSPTGECVLEHGEVQDVS